MKTMANKNRQHGKAVEKYLAKRLGAKRIGILGAEDLSHPIFSYEIKSRKSFVALSWMNQAKRNAPEGKIPIVVFHQKFTEHNQDLVFLKLTDWEDLHREVHHEKEISITN